MGSLLPGVLYWNGGQADIQVKSSIQIPKNLENLDMDALLKSLQLNGKAWIQKGNIVSPIIKDPLQNLVVNAEFDKHRFKIQEISSKVGPQGSIDVSGAMPYKSSAKSKDTLKGNQLTAKLSNLDFRIPILYTGQIDSYLSVTGSLDKPTLGGHIKFCKGSIQLQQSEDVQGI